MTEEGRKIFNMVLALLVAIGAWVFVVYNYDPMTDVTYREVPISYTGLDSLANRGYAVAGSSHDTVDVRLNQRRIDTGSISGDDISVTADVSGLSTGENTVTLKVSGPDGSQVSDVSHKTIVINVESADSEDMEISFEYSEAPAENEAPLVSDVSASYATVIAAEDTLADIDRVAAVIDPEEVGEQSRAMTLQLAALDKEGNKVNSVIIEPETVSFKAARGFTKEVALKVNVKDESDDSYTRTYTAPETITVIGSKGAIESLSSISTEEADITYLYEDTEMPLELDMPGGVYPADIHGELVLKVKVAENSDED